MITPTTQGRDVEEDAQAQEPPQAAGQSRPPTRRGRSATFDHTPFKRNVIFCLR
jgi:hypothetical protein